MSTATVYPGGSGALPQTTYYQCIGNPVFASGMPTSPPTTDATTGLGTAVAPDVTKVAIGTYPPNNNVYIDTPP